MIYDKELIQRWFLEIDYHPDSARVDTQDSVAIIYKGFKLELFEDFSYIFDVRFRDLYGPVSKKNLSLMKRLGFERACDMIQYRKDGQRMKRSIRVLNQLENKRSELVCKGNPKSARTINGIDQKCRQHLSDYHMYVARHLRLKEKLESFNLI